MNKGEAFQKNTLIWEKIYKEGGSGAILKCPCEDFVVCICRYLSGPEWQGKKVLEIGFGSGNNLIYLLGQGFDCYAVEVSESAVDFTKKRLSQEGLTAHLEVIKDNKYPYKDGFFDIVCAWHVLSHNTEEGLSEVIAEIYRVLKPEGILLATFPTFRDFRFAHGRRLSGKTFEFTHEGSNQNGAIITAAETEKDVRGLFSPFADLKIGYSEITVNGITNSHWLIYGRKSKSGAEK